VFWFRSGCAGPTLITIFATYIFPLDAMTDEDDGPHLAKKKKMMDLRQWGPRHGGGGGAPGGSVFMTCKSRLL
jgi:hypothetical protein